MRCKNCGWTNPDNAERCEKCNRPLITSTVSSSAPAVQPRQQGFKADPSNQRTRYDASGSTPQPSDYGQRPQPNTDNKSTQLYVTPQTGPDATETPANCPDCGYPLTPGTTICPNCQKKFGAAEQPAVETELSCMDNAEHTLIKISSPQQIGLKPGEIILIAGLRYQVK